MSKRKQKPLKPTISAPNHRINLAGATMSYPMAPQIHLIRVDTDILKRIQAYTKVSQDARNKVDKILGLR